MIQDLEQIEYRNGMLDKGMKPEDLPVKVWTCLRRVCGIPLTSFGPPEHRLDDEMKGEAHGGPYVFESTTY